MVTFNKDSFTVTVETGTDPVEDWLATQNELIESLQAEADDMHEKRFHYLTLLKALLPDWETAKKMTVNVENLRQQ